MDTNIKKQIFIICITFTLFISCGGQKDLKFDEEASREELGIRFNMIFLNQLKNKITDAKLGSLLREREEFLKCNTGDNLYEKNINFYIKGVDKMQNDYNAAFLSNIVKRRKKNILVKNVYMFTIVLSGEQFSRKDILLIENLDRTVEIFSTEKKNIFKTDRDIVEFTDEFMENLPYPFQTKTPSLNGSLSIYRITPKNNNEISITSKFISGVMNYQLEIIDKMYLGAR